MTNLMIDLMILLSSIIAVCFVFVPHEFAHAFVAYKCGDGTAKMQGRMTLNPVKHIDPVGIILCIFAGFGWAKPVPINPYNFTNFRKGLFLTAIAGVVTNYIVAFFAYPLHLALDYFALPAVLDSDVLYYLVFFLDQIFFLTFLYSLSVFIFNLLPLYPLDGFRVIESFTREINPVRKFLRNYGYYTLIGLVLESILCDVLYTRLDLEFAQYFDILGYVQWFAQEIIGFPITALWNLIFGIKL